MPNEEDKAVSRRDQLKRDLLADPIYRQQYAINALIGNVSEQVQALRRQRGMSQEDLAALADTKQPRISNLEAPSPVGKGAKRDYPNWELATLIKVAQALDTRLKISFETYGSLLDELESVTSDSLRRETPENDPLLSSHPKLDLKPNPAAPESVRWMQELMLPWLSQEKLDVQQLVKWLDGADLPPVGHDEEPYHWLLRGIDLPHKPTRDYLERRFAERLAVVLGEQPDVAPVTVEDHDNFLSNLYWTCAGIQQRGFLDEPLWGAYKRLKETKLPGNVRDALQGALVHNQFGERKPFLEIWKPMIEKGRHRWLRGSELIGYRGIVERYKQFGKKNLEPVLWALGEISRRWEMDRKAEFEGLIGQIPDWKTPLVAERIAESAHNIDSGWSSWARTLVPILTEKQHSDDSGEIGVKVGDHYASLEWSGQEFEVRGSEDEFPARLDTLARPVNRRFAWNHLAMEISDRIESDNGERIDWEIAHSLALAAINNPPAQIAA